MGKGAATAGDSDASNLENWSDKDSQVVVSQRDGFMCNIKMHAKIDLDPMNVFHILTDPTNGEIFKSIKSVPYRKVLKDDGHGKQLVEVEHVAGWRFLMFKGTFSTRLFVEQDKRAGTIKFRLAKPGLMKAFEGSWSVQPFNQQTLDRLSAPAAQTSGQQEPQWFKPAMAFANSRFASMPFMQDRRSGAALVTLEQSLLPAFVPPKPLDRLIKGIAAKQIRIMLEDLREEVDKINKGKKKSPLALQAEGFNWEEDKENGGSRLVGRKQREAAVQVAPAATLSIAWAPCANPLLLMARRCS